MLNLKDLLTTIERGDRTKEMLSLYVRSSQPVYDTSWVAEYSKFNQEIDRRTLFITGQYVGGAAAGTPVKWSTTTGGTW